MEALVISPDFTIEDIHKIRDSGFSEPGAADSTS